MKIITRTVVILLVAVLVIGATIGLVNAGAIPGLSEEMPARNAPAFSDNTTDATTSVAAPNFQHGSEGMGHHEEGGGIGGAVTIGKNLGIIAVIVAIVASAIALIERLGRRGRGQRTPPAMAGR